MYPFLNSNLTTAEFNDFAIRAFQYQAEFCSVYRDYLNHLKVDVQKIKKIEEIPFLPIAFFKNKTVVSGVKTPELTFTSSSTTGTGISQHHVIDKTIYKKSFEKAFNIFYGNPENYCILALLPSYLERSNSSLVYMVKGLMDKSNHPLQGFFLNNLEELKLTIEKLEKAEQQYLLIGVSFALTDLAEKYPTNIRHGIILETGGMKGRKKELTREQLHQIFHTGFGVKKIHSEYGMTELLSQAYSFGDGIYNCPPWMKIYIRDTHDPFQILETGKSGGINVIDLANINSCCFIETSDLGILHNNGSFEVLGRFDNSDIRGCSLMAAI